MVEQLTHFIDGAAFAGISGNFQDAFNPATGENGYGMPQALKGDFSGSVATNIDTHY